RNPLSVLSTQHLIANRLPNHVQEPWVWQELERRLTAGNLTKAEVDQAIGELTADMTRAAPAGWNKPLPWQQGFIKSVLKNGMISQPVYFALCDAFYGPTPVVTLASLGLNEHDTRFRFDIKYGSTWSDSSGLGTGLVWDVKQVLLDGNLVKVRNLSRPFD